MSKAIDFLKEGIEYREDNAVIFIRLFSWDVETGIINCELKVQYLNYSGYKIGNIHYTEVNLDAEKIREFKSAVAFKSYILAQVNEVLLMKINIK